MRPARSYAGTRVAGIAAAVVAGAASGCAAGHYQQVFCAGSRQSIFILEAQAVPSAAYIPCVTPLPAGWSYAGSTVRTGFVQFWLDSDRAGPHAAEVTLTNTCDVSAAVPISLAAAPAGLRRHDEPAGRHPQSSVSYYVFAGGCVTYRLTLTRQTTPALYDEADHLLGFTHGRYTSTAYARTPGSHSAAPKPHPAPDRHRRPRTGPRPMRTAAVNPMVRARPRRPDPVRNDSIHSHRSLC